MKKEMQSNTPSRVTALDSADTAIFYPHYWFYGTLGRVVSRTLAGLFRPAACVSTAPPVCETYKLNRRREATVKK